MAGRRKRDPLRVESLRHEEAERANIPSAEHQPLMKDEDERSIQAAEQDSDAPRKAPHRLSFPTPARRQRGA